MGKEIVYVVTIHSASYGELCTETPRVFRKLEDAKKFLKDCKDEAISEGWVDESWEVEENKDGTLYEAFEQDLYNRWHYCVQISETEILGNW